ncbi:MAG: fused MFS/spermidine synthase [Gammaproteobacteria bacterium]|nr:fused MFS/spermidine synthase [Gammaproteobacteria bacterium]
MKNNKHLLISEKTPWGEIQVCQDDNFRYLYLQEQKAVQSKLDIEKKEELQLQHCRAMMSFLLFQSEPKSLLLLGLGGGNIIHFLSHWFPEINITAVDINEKMVDISKKYFAVTETSHINIEVSDAFSYMAHQKADHTDVILVDIHDGIRIPDFIENNEFMSHCYHTLSEKGVLIINVIAADDEHFLNIMRTLRKSFTGVSLCISLKDNKNILVCAVKSLSTLDMNRLHNKADKLQQKYGIEFSQFIQDSVKLDEKQSY